jgi:hypothetical protein
MADSTWLGILHGTRTSDAGTSSQHAPEQRGPLYFHTHPALRLHAGDQVKDRERPCAQRVTEAQEIQGISHTTWRRGERDLKRGNPKGCQQTTDFWVPSCFYFHVLFPQ